MAFATGIDYSLFIHAVVGVFVIVNPFGNVPIFITLTQKFSPEERKSSIIKAMVIATAILLVFALIGQTVLNLLNVTLDSLRIAGGLLLLAIAFDMLMGKSPASRIDADEERESVAVTPMATPLLAGPGAMTTVMIWMNEAASEQAPQSPVLMQCLVLIAILIAMAAAFAILINSDLMYRVIRKDGARVLTKVMGIVLATIAVEMVISGLLNAFPILGR